MTNNINPINNYPPAVSFPAYKEKQETEKGVVEQEAKKAPADDKQVSAGDVLGYMAAANVDVQPKKVKKVLDISKYVTPEQANRIAGFVQGFEAEVEKGLLAFDTEFPGNNMSDESKMDIVVGMFERNNM